MNIWPFQNVLSGELEWQQIMILFTHIFLLVNADYLSSFGIKRFSFIRSIFDETQTNIHRKKRSIIENNPDRILKLVLDHK